MKRIKFISNNNHQKEFSTTVRKKVNDYFKENDISPKGNIALFIQTSAMLTIYLLPFILILLIPMNGWIAMLLSAIMGLGMAGVGMCVMHDALHGSYSHNEWVNKILGWTMYILGSNVFNWKIQHNVLHHAYTNIEGYDHDIDSRGPLRLSENAPLHKIHKYQYIHAFFLYGFITISKLVKDFSQLIEFTKLGLTKQHAHNPTMEYVKMVIFKIMYLVLFVGLPIIFTEFSWYQVILGFFIMHFTGGCVLSTIFQMAHVVEGAEQLNPNVDGNIENDWVVHELRTTSNFARNNLFLNWYIGGLNFQIEHHLFPNICHIHYRKISPIVEKTANEFGYDYNLKPSFMNALVSHVKRLKQLGVETA